MFSIETCQPQSAKSSPRRFRHLAVVTLSVLTRLLVYQTPAGPIHGTVLFPGELAVTSTQLNLVSVVAADIDGDGWPDLVASSNNPEKITWYRNLGNGTFDTTQYIICTTAFAFSNVSVGDLDGDGRPDMAFWCGDQFIKWCRNVGGTLASGLFAYNAADQTANQRIISAAPNVETGVVIANVNNDGLPDIVTASVYNDNTLAWYRNLGGGNFGWNPGTPTANRITVSTEGISPTSVQVADINADGISDLIVTSRNDGTLAWFRGNAPASNPTFTRFVISNALLSARDCSAGDFDGDGWLDVACAAPGSGTAPLTWFRNTSHDPVPTANSFGPAQTVSTSIIGAYSVASRDMNTDGRMDVVTVAAGGNKVFWCENLGLGNFGWNAGSPAANQKVISTAVSFPISVETTDFNLDGVPDVTAVSNGNGKLSAYTNLGGQTAVATSNTAPATLKEGRRDAALRFSVSNLGVAGDNNARLNSVTMLFERSAGVPLTTAEANALIDTFYIFLDSNSSGVFEPATDTLVASFPNLALTNGRQNFSLASATPANVSVGPASTRNYFAVAKIAVIAAAQTPNSFRVTHISHGLGNSVLKDATTGTTLTVESATITNSPSSLITALPAQNYTDWSYLSFDTAGTPGTAPLESQSNDNTTNLLKYALSVDPLPGASATGMPQVIRQGANRVFRHLKPSWATDLTYRYEISRTLGSWATAVAGVDYLKSDTPLQNGVIQSDLTILGAWTKSFMRVRVDLAN